MSIVLDAREHGLISILSDQTVKQLPVGDIWIQKDEQTILVIERKTTADFEASFLDGRYREQRTRLLAYCAENKAKALYILEGGLDGRRHKLERSSLQKLVHRLLLRYGVAVWCTKDIHDTVNTIRLLKEQIQDDVKVFEGEQLSYTDVQHVTKKANKDDPSTFAIGSLQICPGISLKGAQAIWESCNKSWIKLLEISENDLANVKVGERRLGPAVAKRLWKLFHETNTTTQ
jgi:ERCC4-type nuclease